MKVLFLSHSIEGPVVKVGSHHLSRELARLGHDVAHLSTPLSLPQALLKHDPITRLRRRAALNGAHRDEYGRINASYLTPLPVQLHPQTALFARRARELGFTESDLVLIDQPLMNYRACFPRATVIYRPTDIHPEGAMHARERQIVATCDGIVATSPEVLASLQPYRDRLPVLVLENGVDLTRFTGANTPSGDRRGFVYVGAVDARFDWPAIHAIAERTAEPIDIYGPERIERPPLPPNVTVHGPIAYDTLPERLACYRTGLLPFNDHPLNRGRSPMKYFEYLAAGLRVLGRATPELERRSTPGVVLYRTLEELDVALAQLAALPVPNLDGPAIAATMDWSARARELLDFAQTIRAER